MRLTYANVTSTVALFVALGGTTAFAASKLPDRSVGEFQLRPGAVTASKIRKNAITAPKIKAQAVKQGKIANGSITAAKMTAGSVASASIQDGSILNAKLGPEAVTGDKALESTFSRVPSAQRADSAVFADSASPEAFARVTKEATIDSSQSKGVSVYEGSLDGIYCVVAADFNPRGAQVTPYFEGGGTVTVFAKVDGTLDCPAPAVEVQTFENGSRAKEGFYVVLYR
jgi:hypothetical protein